MGAREGVRHLGCWAHARRKFSEAQKVSNPTGKKPPRTGKADMALSYINRLYAIEREVKDAGADERRRLRQTRSKAILGQLREQALLSWSMKAEQGVIS